MATLGTSDKSTEIKILSIKDIKNTPAGSSAIGQEITAQGWIKTVRHQKTFSFVALNDGSCLSNLQLVLNEETQDYESLKESLTTGASIEVKGILVESQGKGQSVEIQAKHINVVGACCAETFPLQKKRHSFEFLRTIAHLRPRTNTIGAVTRVRSALSFATHEFFNQQGFNYIHTPIITASDCEGAGQMFCVKTKEEGSDKLKDFFGKPAYLTVSGQLNAEIYALALSKVYTFGPTFRAENSNTTRHLAEFWMIEPEMAFCDLNQDIDNAEAYVKHVINYVLKHCEEDLNFFNSFIEKGLIDRLKNVLDNPFERIDYSEAIEILQNAKQKFQYNPEWGCDLQTEHERYLTEVHFKKPVVVKNYPKEIKAFYMRRNDDGKTVAAMDVLVPKVGELIGGSQREEREDVLKDVLKSQGLDEKDYWWYLELRKFGGVPHAGYGLGFERLIQFITGMENIRDVIPFPRFPGNAEF